jgi:hypothetical protein
MPTAAFVTWPWWPKAGMVPAAGSASVPSLTTASAPSAARRDTTAGPGDAAGFAAAEASAEGRPAAQSRAWAVHAAV